MAQNEREGLIPQDELLAAGDTPLDPFAYGGRSAGRLVGRKTGRIAPRVHHRIPKREMTLVEHGLLKPGDVDPRQGELFEGSQYDAYGNSQAAYAKDKGFPVPLASSRPGFLPGIEGNTRFTAHQRKMEALRIFGETRRTRGSRVGTGASPSFDTMDHLSGQFGSRGHVVSDNWYSEVRENEDGTKSVHEGVAARQIREIAHRITPHDEPVNLVSTTRAAAQMSARMPWSEGNPLQRAYPNLELTEAVGRNAVDARQLSNSARVPLTHAELEGVGERTPGTGLPLNKRRAAVSLGDQSTATEPLPAGANYQKIPNFNESLLMSAEGVPYRLRGAYASSYTSDVWDRVANALPEDFDSRMGQYDVFKMLANRTSFKMGELPPNVQSHVWGGVRTPDPLTTSVGGREQLSLLQEHQGALTPQFDSMGNRLNEHGHVIEHQGTAQARPPAMNDAAQGIVDSSSGGRLKREYPTVSEAISSGKRRRR